MKKLILTITVLGLVLSSCERVFTASPFDFLQRDPSTYTAAQQIRYAQDALASGDEAAMAAAFALLSDSTDPDTQLLAVELALGAAGVETVLTSVMAGVAVEGADIEAVLSDALGTFADADLAMLVAAATLLDQADDSAQPSAEQYAFVAIGLIAAAADDAGGIDSINPPPAGSAAETYVNQASAFLTAAADLSDTGGEPNSLLDGFADLIP